MSEGTGTPQETSAPDAEAEPAGSKPEPSSREPGATEGPAGPAHKASHNPAELPSGARSEGASSPEARSAETRSAETRSAETLADAEPLADLRAPLPSIPRSKTIPPPPGTEAPSLFVDSSPPVREAPVEPLPPIDLTQPELLINRELSWLEFNQRVLNEAVDPTVPLLERLKFAAITTSNLDEFFMVRLAGLVEQVADNIQKVPADGMSPQEQIAAIAVRTRRMVDDLYTVVREQILPELAQEGVRLVSLEQLSVEDRSALRNYFTTQVLPILTPLAIDPGHPFPHVRNKSLNLVAILSGSGYDSTSAFAVVQVPRVVPRLVRIGNKPGGADFMLLEDVIAAHLGELFPGFSVLGAWPFRILRNSDLDVDEEEAEDLLETVHEEIRRRDKGRAVRLSVAADADGAAVDLLERSLKVDRQFVYHIDGPLNLPALTAMGKPIEDRSRLRDAAFTPVVLPPLPGAEDIFSVIRNHDLLLHHPYESFDPVVQFVESAAEDPQVLAIKQTLYRTSGDSPVVKSLVRAAENGKQVAALVEIKARFDEENNIQWARRLEDAGVHVVYGLLGLKTHCKTSLVVRREGDRLRRYVHLGTGNYNPTTARLYTDISYFTASEDIATDATSLFNLLTSCTAPESWRKLIVAPLGLHERVLAMVEREATFARAGRPARIIAKMNSLVDPDVIRALYRASQAGVEIDLVVRGICCLRPGLPEVSERIRVRSIVDRFLEHSRLFFFEAGGARELYASSADWMPRNFHRRVEVMFPIEAEHLKSRVLDEVLQTCLDDDQKASILDADGSYRRPPREPGAPPIRSQERFLALARHAAELARMKEREERPFVVRPVRNRPTKDAPPDPKLGPVD
ncbi:MAG: polyphosphate kinase 1 [Myxococcota bacterium]